MSSPSYRSPHSGRSGRFQGYNSWHKKPPIRKLIDRSASLWTPHKKAKALPLPSGFRYQDPDAPVNEAGWPLDGSPIICISDKEMDELRTDRCLAKAEKMVQEKAEREREATAKMKASGWGNWQAAIKEDDRKYLDRKREYVKEWEAKRAVLVESGSFEKEVSEALDKLSLDDGEAKGAESGSESVVTVIPSSATKNEHTPSRSSPTPSTSEEPLFPCLNPTTLSTLPSLTPEEDRLVNDILNKAAMAAFNRPFSSPPPAEEDPSYLSASPPTAEASPSELPSSPPLPLRPSSTPVKENPRPFRFGTTTPANAKASNAPKPTWPNSQYPTPSSRPDSGYQEMPSSSAYQSPVPRVASGVVAPGTPKNVDGGARETVGASWKTPETLALEKRIRDDQIRFARKVAEERAERMHKQRMEMARERLERRGMYRKVLREE